MLQSASQLVSVSTNNMLVTQPAGLRDHDYMLVTQPAGLREHEIHASHPASWYREHEIHATVTQPAGLHIKHLKGKRPHGFTEGI